MKKIIKIAVTFLSILTIASNAQTGASPQSAYLVTNSNIDSVFTIPVSSGSEYWIKYPVTQSKNFIIHVNSFTDTTNTRVIKAVAYAYQGGSPILIGADSLGSGTDTSLAIFVRNGGIPDTSVVTGGGIGCRIYYPGAVLNDTVYVKLIKANVFAASFAAKSSLLRFEFSIESVCGEPIYIYNNLCVPNNISGLSNCTPLCQIYSGSVTPCTLTVCLNTPVNFWIGLANGSLCGLNIFDDGCNSYTLVSQAQNGSGVQYTVNQYQFVPQQAGVYTISVIPSFPMFPGFGCGAGTMDCPPASFVLNVLPTPVSPVLIVNPNPVCAGESPVCYTQSGFPSGAYTYTLNTGVATYYGNNNSPIQNPFCTCLPNAITYNSSLTIQDQNGCKATASVPVHVQPIQAAINYTQNCDVFHFTATPISCVQAGAFYSWNFGDGGTSSAQNPQHVYSSTGTFNVTLTITNTCGSATFSSQVTLSTKECCTNPSGAGRTPVNVTTGTVVGTGSSGTTTILNTDFTVHGNQIIKVVSPTTNGATSTVNFNNCTFLMYPGSKIVIFTNGTNVVGCGESSTLTVNFNNCHLWGCSQLWEGISFDHATFNSIACNGDFVAFTFNTNLNINNTLLEDAYKGVDNNKTMNFLNSLGLQNLTFTTSNSMYNNNYNDLFLDQEKLTASSFSKNCTYNSRAVYNANTNTGAYAPPSQPLPVFSNASSYYSSILTPLTAGVVKPSSLNGFAGSAYSWYGVKIYGPSSHAVGQTFNVSSNQNLYDRHYFGIHSTNVNLTAERQYFYNLDIVGTSAILTYGNQNTSGAAPNVVLGTTINNGNNFNNCYTGITSYFRNTNMNIAGNQFYKVRTGIRVDGFSTASNSTNCNVTNNIIKNVSNYGIWFNVNNGINALVQNNQIFYTSNTYTNYFSKGIVVNEATSTNANPMYNITTNNINNTYTGIECSETHNAQITSNTIKINTPPSSQCATCWNYGINNYDCYGNAIGNNTITGDNVQYHWWEYGINSVHHPMQNIYCNSITGTNTGLNLQDVSPTPTNPDLPIRNNDLYENLIDVWMLNKSYLGPQRVPIWTFNFPTDNTFNHTGGYLYNSYCSGGPPSTLATFGNQSPFYVRSMPTKYDFLTNGNQAINPPSTPMNPVHVNGGLPNPCNNGGGSSHLLNLAHRVAVDSLVPPIEKRDRFVSRRDLYRNIMLENINTSGDAALVSFKNNEAASGIGMLFSIEKTVSDGIKQNNPSLFTAAAQSNNAFVSSDSIELLHKQVNRAYIGYLKNGYGFLPSDLTILQQIAPLCPFIYGTAVWQARSLLAGVDSVQYSSTCEVVTIPQSGVQRTVFSSVSENEPAKVSIYPNPSRGEFYLQYKLSEDATFVLYDLTGGIVGEHKIPAEKNEVLISESALPAGLYSYKILVGNSTIEKGKMAIIK